MTRGHNIIADGWQGHPIPHPHPNSHCTLKLTQKHPFFPLFISFIMDRPTDQRTSEWMDGQTKPLIWKKVEEYLWLFETYGGNRFSLFLMRRLGKLVSFWARMTLRMKLIAQKELIFLFQMAPSRILCDQ